MKFLDLFDVSVEIENKTSNFVNLFVTLREIINNEKKKEFLIVGLLK